MCRKLLFSPCLFAARHFGNNFLISCKDTAVSMVTRYILVMQRFRVVYYEISHESLVFSRYTHEPLGECVYEENTIDKWDIPYYYSTIAPFYQIIINETSETSDFV